MSVAQLTTFEASALYMSKLGEIEFQNAMSRHEEAQGNGSRAFREGCFVGAAVVPSLISEETCTIQTLEMLRASSSGDKAIVVSANMPDHFWDTRAAKKQLREVRDYIGDHSDFPMTYFAEAYEPGTPIGMVLRDGYGVLATHAFEAGEDTPNFPVTRCDVDVTPGGIPANYLDRVWNSWVRTRRHNVAIYPRTVHGKVEGDFPRLNRSIDWMNRAYGLGSVTVPANVTVDLKSYLLAGGYRSSWRCSEDRLLRNAMTEVFEEETDVFYLKSMSVEFSPRRLAQYMLEGREAVYDDISVPEDGAETHRTKETSRDLTDQEYAKVAIRDVLHVVRREGAEIYRTILGWGTDTDADAVLDSARRAMLDVVADEPAAVKELCASSIAEWKPS